MKHFKIIGEETTTEFDIEDDEALEFYAIKETDLYKQQTNPMARTLLNKKDYDTNLLSHGSHPPHLRNLEN